MFLWVLLCPQMYGDVSKLSVGLGLFYAKNNML